MKRCIRSIFLCIDVISGKKCFIDYNPSDMMLDMTENMEPEGEKIRYYD